ncbi:MAG: aryl-sulfate sulfotransferase [Lachnospiraceae bacterium]|nr:aryl-sulfate sulfotransferase [Lachnospiraceae bacterium]
MNKALKVLLGMMVVSGIVLCVLLGIMLKDEKGKTVSKLKEFQEKYEERQTDSRTIAPMIYEDFSALESTDGLYDVARHTEVYERIEALKRDGIYTKDNPLVIYNPYGVNALSVYVYFTTEVPVKTSYRVSVQAEEIPTFTANCNDGQLYTMVHEYLLIGLTAEESNRVSLVMEDEEGNSNVRTFYVTAGSQFGTGKKKLDVGKGVSTEGLSDGLFAHFGNISGEKETVSLYDNDGILRSEFPLLSGSAKRFVFLNNKVYFNISDTQIVAMNPFGRAEQVYSIDGYTIGEDYCADETGLKLLVTASKNPGKEKVASINDRLLCVDLLSGEVKELLDMGVLLKEYKEICKKNQEGVLDWLGLNSVQMWNDSGVLLGAREPSAAFKIKDIYGIPMLDYIIGEEEMFENTGYEEYLLTKEDDFEAFVGANTFTCMREELMSSGMYILYLYDNHIGGSESRPEFDYNEMASDLGSSLKKGETSYFCRYLVNETARTWELTESVPLDYSGYKGSAQLTPEGHLITDTAGRFAYSEFDGERNLIRKYTAAGTEYLARVLKYDFKGFFFAGEYDALTEKDAEEE